MCMAENEASARGWHLPVSPKHSREIAAAIRGKKLSDAIKFVEKVAAMEVPVEMRRHNRKVGHKNGRPARFPVKAARAILKILKNVEANAEYKGLEKENLLISRIEVYRGSYKRPFMSRAFCKSPRSRGRRASISVVVKEEEK